MRRDAESLLANTAPGSFLIRVGESRIGYSLSYKTANCYRHFMIDVVKGYNCRLSGDPKMYQSLQELVQFHMRHPIYPFNEILSHPCGQKTNSATDYGDLFKHANDPITNNHHMKSTVNTLPVPGTMHNGMHMLPTPTPGLPTAFTPVPPPRRNKSKDCVPQMPHPPNMPPMFAPQPVMGLYPFLPQQVPLSGNGFVPVLQNGQIQWNYPNPAVNPSLPPNTNGMARFPTPVQCAMGMQAPLHPIATHAWPVNTGNFVPAGHPSTNPGPQQNVGNKLSAEEYKQPPPFAPGFY
uniref:Hematopoietic SH2 domain containing n=1 Tax=Leptobrachium leishanense TaxID=445787 RepID=A0A8C5Q3Y1_9ANUR